MAKRNQMSYDDGYPMDAAPVKKKKKKGGLLGRIIRRFFLLVFTVVILAVTNSDDFAAVELTASGKVSVGDGLMNVRK